MRRDSGRFALLCLGSLQLVFLTFFVGLKIPTYLILALPFFAALVVVGIILAFRNGSSFSWGSVILAGVLVLCQLGTLLSFIKADSYHREYLPTVQFVREAVGQKNEMVIANDYFGFDLGFGRLRDDERLGFYSGLHPDIVIEDEFYTFCWDRVFKVQEPEVASYVRQLLGTQYRLVFSRGPYRVYERRGPEQP